jgi:Tripartite tricarboxylate transporter family receptor
LTQDDERFMDHAIAASATMGFTTAMGERPFTLKPRSLLSLASEPSCTKFASRVGQRLLTLRGAMPRATAVRRSGTSALCELGRALCQAVCWRVLWRSKILFPKAAPQTVSDLIGNRIDLALLAPSTALTHIKAGKIKALGVTVGERLAASTDIPAVSDSSEPKGLHVTSAIGCFAPAKTPVAIVERLNRELDEILTTPEVRKTFEEQAATVDKGSGAESAEFLRNELVHNAAVVLAAKLKGD